MPARSDPRDALRLQRAGVAGAPPGAPAAAARRAPAAAGLRPRHRRRRPSRRARRLRRDAATPSATSAWPQPHHELRVRATQPRARCSRASTGCGRRRRRRGRRWRARLRYVAPAGAPSIRRSNSRCRRPTCRGWRRCAAYARQSFTPRPAAGRGARWS